MIESKLKANNYNRGQLFRPYWVSSDLLQFLRQQAAFSFAVLCIIMLNCTLLYIIHLKYPPFRINQLPLTKSGKRFVKLNQ